MVVLGVLLAYGCCDVDGCVVICLSACWFGGLRVGGVL